MAHALAVVSQKGGVGKTTTAANLAAALTKEGQDVLLLEVDPQGALVPSLGLEIEDLHHSLIDVLQTGMDPRQAVVASPIEGLSLLAAYLPGQDELLLERVAASHMMALREVVDKLVPHYDTIVMDGPPTLGHLTRMTLAAADAYLVPVQAEELSYRTLTRFMETMELVKADYNPDLSCAGLLITMADLRTRMSVKVINQLHENYGDKLLVSMVPRTVTLQDMPLRGMPTVLYAPTSRGARAYQEVASEILNQRRSVGRDEFDDALDHDSLLDDLTFDAPQVLDATFRGPAVAASPSAWDQNPSLYLTALGLDHDQITRPVREEDDRSIH